MILRLSPRTAMKSQKAMSDKARTIRTILRLRQLRKSYDMTQADLGRRVGLDQRTIQAIEAGRAKPSFDKALAIAGVFKTPVEEVFSHVEVPL